MKKLLLLIIILALSCNTLNLHSADFLVLSMYGNITMKSNSSDKWVRVKTGAELTELDEVKLSEKSYICLYHNNGKSIEINKAGRYQLSSYAERIRKKGKSAADVVGKYIFKQIFEADNNILNNSQTGKMSISIGGVERGLDTPKSESDLLKSKKINVFLPSHCFTIDKVIEFSWYPIKKIKKYRFIISDSIGDTIFSDHASGPRILIDLEKLNIQRDICYFWTVSTDSLRSESYCIYLFNKLDEESILADVEEIEEQFEGENSPLKDMTLAIYYSSKKIDNRAIKHYQKAIQSAPGSIEYRKIYALYLAKSGYQEEATKVLNIKD